MSEQQKKDRRHLFATIVSLTERGGRVTQVTSNRTIAGPAVARAGDVVTYDDGSEATIMDGACCALSRKTNRCQRFTRADALQLAIGALHA